MTKHQWLVVTEHAPVKLPSTRLVSLHAAIQDKYNNSPVLQWTDSSMYWLFPYRWPGVQGDAVFPLRMHHSGT